MKPDEADLELPPDTKSVVLERKCGHATAGFNLVCEECERLKRASLELSVVSMTVFGDRLFVALTDGVYEMIDGRFHRMEFVTLPPVEP